ncbi:MAG: hypothetical protein H0U15_02515 [Geodermatophilaceae bacterium]|nr:hypothetical protein [Geodermatophilaceae bacterium]
MFESTRIQLPRKSFQQIHRENVSREAYAFASCTDCAAVAVGFQVVLVLGQANIVVPRNLAAAVNYNCVSCVTYALATQLVITLDGPLSEVGMAELAVLWEEIAEFGRNIQGVPLSQLQARLTAYEQRIVDIIEKDSSNTLTTSESGTAGTPQPTSSDPASTPRPTSTGNAPQQSQTSTAQPRPTSSSPTAEPEEASTTADTSAPSSTVETSVTPTG